jgi:hypothetical protein
LVLSQSRNFCIHGSLVAENTGDTYAASVSLNSLEKQRARHSAQILGRLCIGECLVCSFLLQAVEVRHVSCTGGGCSVAQEAEDDILDALGVVKVEELAGDCQHKVVRVFLGNFALVKMGDSLVSRRMEMGWQIVNRRGVSQTNQDSTKCGNRELHVEL